MSKLFISYSRDDKAWVLELWRALRDRAHHDAWIDQRLVPAQDWWEGILHNIETCDCFIYVMTHRSTESIYCSEELNYALALNKPVLPLMLKPCDLPQAIQSRRIQYETVRDDMSMGDTLFAVAQGLTEVLLGLERGKYPIPSPLPNRPDEPRPELKREQIAEVLMLAEEAAAENNISHATKLFQQVIDLAPSNWSVTAAERLVEIQHEHNRNRDYLTIVEMTAKPILVKVAKTAWRTYVKQYGEGYDPQNIATFFIEQKNEFLVNKKNNSTTRSNVADESTSRLSKPTVPQSSKKRTPKPLQIVPTGEVKTHSATRSNMADESTSRLSKPTVPQSSKKRTPKPPQIVPTGEVKTDSVKNLNQINDTIIPLSNSLSLSKSSNQIGQPSQLITTVKRSKSVNFMPTPFGWVDILAGKVTLGGNNSTNGGYIQNKTTFDVPAFSIAKYPITNAQFSLFIKGGGYRQEKWWTPDGWKMRERERLFEPRFWYYEKWNKPNKPVVGVSWYEAVAFCQWLSEISGEVITLPTEQQWQRAAQGDTQWAYPYGDQFDGNRCNFNTNGTTPVTQFEGENKSDSPFGVVDMSGNVWEWCSTKYETGTSQLGGIDVRVLRGGSWGDISDYLRVDFRNWDQPDSRNDVYGGFRIARS